GGSGLSLRSDDLDTVSELYTQDDFWQLAVAELLQRFLSLGGVARPTHAYRYGLQSEPDLHPGGVRRVVSGAVARRARPDRRLDRAADDGGRPRRLELSVLGGDGLSTHQHGRRPALWKIRRSLRPEDRAASGNRRVSRRLRAVRHRAEHAAADRLSRARGRRR